ncbi:multicopper oxidase domain-containing protein, partial [Nocardioides sp. P5_C9_2]
MWRARTLRTPRRRSALAAAASASLLCLVTAGAVSPDASSAPPPAPPDVGIVCTPGVGGDPTHPIYDLTTKTGYISLPDGNTAFMWGYSAGFDDFQHPGPVLCVNEGDTVTVILHNTFAEPVSVAFPGQVGVLADGVAAAPEVDGQGRVTSLTDSAAAGGTITYSFKADHPGTFLYESGTNPEKQVRMGLFGALIVRPQMGADHAYDRDDSKFTA